MFFCAWDIALEEHLDSGQSSALTPYQTSILSVCYQSIDNISSLGINLKPKHPFNEKD